MFTSRRMQTTRIIKGSTESDAAFRKRYQDKEVELDYISSTVGKDWVDINYLSKNHDKSINS